MMKLMKPDKPWNFAIVKNSPPEFIQGSEEKLDVDANLPKIVVNGRMVKNWQIVTQYKIDSHDTHYAPIMVMISRNILVSTQNL